MKEHLSTEEIESFLMEKIDKKEALKIKKHLSECSVCMNKANKIKDILQDIEKCINLYSKPEVWERTDSTKMQEIKNTLEKNLRPSEIELKKIKKLIEQKKYHSIITPTDNIEPKEGFRLAASPYKKGFFAKTIGIGISEKGEGALIEVSAWVSDEIKEDANIEVIAKEITGIEEGGRTYSIRTPTEWLKKVISQRFNTIKLLKALNLDKRDVIVEINSPKFLEEAQSLLLAVIIAIIFAATKNTCHENIAFSADLKPNGQLGRVGKIREKAIYAMNKGIKQLIVSKDNEAELQNIEELSDIQIISFFHIDEVIEFLKVKVTIEESISSTPRSTILPKKNTLADYVVFFVSSLLGAIIILLWCLLGKFKFFILSDLISVFNFKLGTTNLFGYMLIIDSLISLFLGTWIFNRIYHERKFMHIVSMIVLIFFAANISLFIVNFYITPKDFERYAQVEYLKHNKYFGRLFDNIPNYTFQKFIELSKSNSLKNNAKAIDIGLKISINDPEFKTVFIEMCILLKNRITDTQKANSLLQRYVDFVAFIKSKKNAKEIIFDTIPYAKSIMKQYRLEETFYRGRTFKAFFESILNEFE